jgi:uncharacterized membrane protein
MDAFIPIVGMATTAATADAIWLTTNMSYHTKLIENIQKSPLILRVVPAALVYVLIIATLYVFAVLESKSLKDAAFRGAGLGLAMYGVYDLTNYSTLTNYTLEMTVKDMAWGTVLCTLVAAAGFYLKPK